METQVRTPQMVFMQPQRLVVPLFQRPYVWNKAVQWEPLWKDVVRVAEKVIAKPSEKHHPHFLGAVVLQQVQIAVGRMQERTIIDGQQRLTTLQILLDALHAELLNVDARQPALRIEPLVSNAEAFCTSREDRFKVWPTNRDRPAFNEVMSASPPIDYENLTHKNEKMVEAHCYFSGQAREWLSANGAAEVQLRATAIETVVRELLQLVVIDLTTEENAQEIFETLNARGTRLSAADLIKNFVFQRLLEMGANVEALYEKHWKDFETGFWEAQVNVGRVNHPRSSIFLNHWLVARTGMEIVASEVFDSFKRFTHDSGVPMTSFIVQIHDASRVYRDFILRASTISGAIDRLGLFGYRTGVLESEVIKPLILCLFDPPEAKISEEQLFKSLSAVESWMVRRMLIRATTKNYSQMVAGMIREIRRDRTRAGDAIEHYLGSQSSASGYWPDDSELRVELQALQVYRRIGRGRLRMILEAIEDFGRGWSGNAATTDNERVTRAKFSIEHVMPRKWAAHWPLDAGVQNDVDRDRVVHMLGNLTLLTGKLNSKISHGPWLGNGGKRTALEAHDVLKLNREIVKSAMDGWSEKQIHVRTHEMIEVVIQIWPVPVGHKSGFVPDRPRVRRKLDLADLINGGALVPGISLFPRRPKFSDHVATLLADGRVELDGKQFDSPSQAATQLVGHHMNGWWFFLVDQASKKSLKHVRRDYVNELSVEDEDEDVDDDDEDDDDASQ